MNDPMYVDIRELFNPKLFQPQEKEDEPSLPIKHLFNGKLTMTVKELAEQLNISEAMAYDMTEKKGFPVIPLGERRKVIPVGMLVEWLEEQAQGGE